MDTFLAIWNIKKRWIFFLLVQLCGFTGHVYADKYTLQGTLYDIVTKKPVSNVNVYLAGTQIGTVSDEKGKYELIVLDIINTSLVFSHLAYEQLILPDPYIELPDTISMIPKDYNLKPVEIVRQKDPFSRAQKMRIFRKQFLGTDKAGKSCIIENEDDIHLFCDMKTRTLTASSEKPLLIKNKYLDYDLYFELLTFEVTFMIQGVSNDWVHSCQFYGTAFFSDNHPTDKRIKLRREEMYRKSDLCFFKNFVNNTMEDTKFILYRNEVAINLLNYFTIRDSLSLKVVSFEPGTLKAPKSLQHEEIIGSIGVLYNKKQRTNILFRTDFFIVDCFGYTNTEDKIIFSGEMGHQRIGNMLPIEYQVDEEN